MPTAFPKWGGSRKMPARPVKPDRRVMLQTRVHPTTLAWLHELRGEEGVGRYLDRLVAEAAARSWP